MSIKSMKTGKATSMVKGVSIGVLIGSVVLSILSLIVAWLIYMDKLSLEHLGYASMLLLFASAYIGSMVSIHLVKRRRLLVSGSTGSVMIVFIVICNCLLMGGHFQGIFITLVMIYTGSLMPAFISTKSRNRSSKKRYHRV